MKRIILIVLIVMFFSTKVYAVDFKNYIENHNKELNNLYYELERPVDDKCNEFMSDIEKDAPDVLWLIKELCLANKTCCCYFNFWQDSYFGNYTIARFDWKDYEKQGKSYMIRREINLSIKGQKALKLFGENNVKLQIKYDNDTGRYVIGYKKRKKDDNYHMQIIDYDYIAKLQKDFERMNIFKAAYLADLQYLTILIESGLYDTLMADKTYKDCTYDPETNVVYDKNKNVVFVGSN